MAKTRQLSTTRTSGGWSLSLVTLSSTDEQGKGQTPGIIVENAPHDQSGGADPEELIQYEWLVTNGLGGYASGTVAGVRTRRYHGLLVAAVPPSLDRVVMLGHLSEVVRAADGTEYHLLGRELSDGSLELSEARHLVGFRLEASFPIFRYRVGDATVEKTVFMPHRQNTVFVGYRMIEGKDPLKLELRPSLDFRHYKSPLSQDLSAEYRLVIMGDRYEVYADKDFPTLRMMIQGAAISFVNSPEQIREVYFSEEAIRGYKATGALWSPGFFSSELSRDHPVTLLASTEQWSVISALEYPQALETERKRHKKLMQAAHPAAREGMASHLIPAADQFVVIPEGRAGDIAKAHAAGQDVRSVIAGYYWFADWGRDTMISLEGLTLVTGRYADARHILTTFANYVKDGLIPNMFPDGHSKGLYNTADATLWYFHAVQRYVDTTGDWSIVDDYLAKFLDMIDCQVHGTLYNIHMDQSDGLLSEGAPNVPLTWMDAHEGDHVITPRRGKAVEINALWYNALCLVAGWVKRNRGNETAKRFTEMAGRVRDSFNRRFWYEKGRYLYDVVDSDDGNDSSCRPNQIFAISLSHPVLDRERWEPVLDVVTEKLLTPYGLRSLSPEDPCYQPHYFGKLETRDQAYHQGTIWPWLIGPFVDAWLKVHPGKHAAARKFLDGFRRALLEDGLGSINEIYDAEKPYTPRGCIAQAWSVAEVLRSWVKTSPHEAQQHPDPPAPDRHGSYE